MGMLNEIILLYNQSKVIMTKNVIGSKIRQIRKRKNITQEMMIARLQSNGFDMSRSTYSKVELEIRQVRDIEIIQFAKALDIDVSELFK